MAKNNSRTIVVAGNWKMYKTIDEALQFMDQLIPLVADTRAKVYVAVPFTAIHPTAAKAKGTSISVGAQNMNDASEGAFTGEIAALMLKEAGAHFVLLGHSERRQIFKESDAFINRKVKRALAEGIQPVVCVGETLEEREANRTEEVLARQLRESLEGISSAEFSQLVLAYEPVWAIGTGRTATPAQAQEAHAFCRRCITELWNPEVADSLSILYGGSVKPDNAKKLMEQEDIDGVLVGGASLDAHAFASIVKAQPTS